VRDYDRREALKLLAAGAACLPLAACRDLAGERRPNPERPNILFLFSDQLRADALGVYGSSIIATPHLDRLAREGVRFTNAVSSCPLCSPYRGMLMTGRYPTHSGIVLNSVRIDPRQRCLAHVFKDAGYATGFIGKWHLAGGCQRYGPDDPETDRAFPRMLAGRIAAGDPFCGYVPPGPDRLGFAHWEAYDFHQSFKDGWYYRDTPEWVPMARFETDAETDLAIAFMRDQARARRPFLLVVAPHPPHPPHRPQSCPEGYLERIPDQIAWRPNVPDERRLGRHLLAARCYHAMVKNLDDNIGRLLAFLDATGLAQSTVIVITSDHGDQLGSHGLGGKCRPFAESVDVPLLVRWPGRVRPGRSVDVLQTPVDHLPTLCGLAGLNAPATADGIDLSPVILGDEGTSHRGAGREAAGRAAGGRRNAGTKARDREAVLMANFVSHWARFESGTLLPEWRAVRTRRHTYVKNLQGEETLFDNAADPAQMKNLAGELQGAPLMDEMRARLQELLAAAHDDFRPGTGYADWYDARRNLVRTGLGLVK
jgi:arylsulfatase A-like enzyme